MHRALLLAVPAALTFAAANAATVRFDFSGTTFGGTQTLPSDDPFTATAFFDTDVAPTTFPPSNDRVFLDALTGLSITIGDETLTANQPGRAFQSGSASSGSTFGFTLNRLSAFDPAVDALDGTITGTDGTVYDPETLGIELILSFVDGGLFDDAQSLLGLVTEDNPITLPGSVGNLGQINFSPASNLDLDVDGGTFTVVSDGNGDGGGDGGSDGGGTPPVIPLPASGMLLLGGLAGLGALRRRG